MTVGSVAQYSCASGSIMEGNDTRFCLPNSQWSGDAPVCTYKSTGKVGREGGRGEGREIHTMCHTII